MNYPGLRPRQSSHRSAVFLVMSHVLRFSIAFPLPYDIFVNLFVLKLPAARPVDETCRRAQVVSLRSSRCRESSKCKEVIPFYCSSLANPAAPLKRDLRFAKTSYGECARCCIFTPAPSEYETFVFDESMVSYLPTENIAVLSGMIVYRLIESSQSLSWGL